MMLVIMLIRTKLHCDMMMSDLEHWETGHQEDMMATLMMTTSLIASRVLGNWMGGGHVLLA